MALVAPRWRGTHMAGVSKTLTALLALVALLLMPLGMSGMAAAASPASLALSAGHCDGHDSEKGAVPAKAEQHCATCMAVPAADAPQATPGLVPEAPRSMTSARPFPGLEPEVITPPPKRV